MSIQYKVIVETSPQDAPHDFEMSAALLVANYFETNVVFLRPASLKSPDLRVKGEIWELKSPRGNGKNTIQNNIKNARKQSANIVIDLRHCKMNEVKALSRIRAVYKKRKRKTGRYLIIKKNGKVLDVCEVL